MVFILKGFFTSSNILWVKANVQPKSSISIGAKVEIGPLKDFTLGVQGWNRKNKNKNSIYPQVTNKC
jgi:hypothetical protein